jgi:hypothetical protein
VVETRALGLDPVDELEHLGRGLGIGGQVGDLRADVAVDAADDDVPACRGAAVETRRVGERDAELALLQAGGDVRVRPRVDVGVDPERHRRADAVAAGDGVERGELGLGLDVEAEDAGRECRCHLGLGLADA